MVREGRDETAGIPGPGERPPEDRGPGPIPDIPGGQSGHPNSDRQPYEPPDNPLVHRESVRMMLLLHYQQQGASGPFRITDSVRSELSRLIPALHEEDIDRLGAPDPSNSTEFFKRLIDAGYLTLKPTVSGP